MTLQRLPDAEQQDLNAYIAPPTPEEVVEIATREARVLMQVVDENQLYVNIQNKKYLKAEAWQTVLAFKGAHAETVFCNPILDGNGEKIGFEAKVNIVDGNNKAIGSGIMPCGFDEFVCRGKTGTARDRAAMSAAQTWAGSKAARQTFAWVVVLAGYEPTPKEEIDPEPQKPAPQRRRRTTTPKAPVQPEPSASDTAREISSMQRTVVWDFTAFHEEGKARRGDNFRGDLEYILKPHGVNIANSREIRHFAQKNDIEGTEAFAKWVFEQFAELDAELDTVNEVDELSKSFEGTQGELR